jgi:hypothetical protein
VGEVWRRCGGALSEQQVGTREGPGGYYREGPVGTMASPIHHHVGRSEADSVRGGGVGWVY